MAQRGWRGAVATWSAAAWMVMQQFAVPTATPSFSEGRIVWSEDISKSLADRETLPDGRIVTMPVEHGNRVLDRHHIRSACPAQLSLN